MLVVGTGAFGLVKGLPEAKQILEAQGISLVDELASEVYNIYKQLWHSKKVSSSSPPHLLNESAIETVRESLRGLPHLELTTLQSSA